MFGGGGIGRKFQLELNQLVEQRLEQELLASVDPKVQLHWDYKIAEGLTLTQVRLEGGRVNPADFQELVDLEVAGFTLFLSRLGREAVGTEVHYFGIGLGVALKRIAMLANQAGMDVVAYDSSLVGCSNGKEVFFQLAGEGNRVYQADIEFACRRKFISPARARVLVASRTLDVLDNVSQDPGKMRRTLRRIGKLMRYVKVLIIHPEPRGNEGKVWYDSTPSPLETVAELAGYGLPRKERGRIKLARFGYARFIDRRYSGGLLELD